MYGIMTDCAEEVNKYLSNAIDAACDGKDVQDVKRLMAKYMTDVTGACVFGIRCNTIRDEDSEFDRMWRRIVTPCFRTRLRNLLRTLCPSLIPVLRLTSHGRTADQFFKIVLKEAVESRKSSGQQRNDFLRLIIDLQAEERNRLQMNGHQVLKTQASEKREQTASNGNIPEPLFTDTVVAANAYVFFAGGYETNINTLIYCLYELALNPSIYEKLRNEVDSVKETNGGVLTFEATKELVYLDAVISETLRKYPPIGMMQRQCTESFRIPDSSVIVEKGTYVFIPVYGLHHDPAYFPEPEKFIPERFIEKQSITPYTYLPFGDGPRICIGMRFAQLQMMTVLCNIISNYTVHPCERTVIPVKYDARATFLSPEGGIWLRFQRRITPIFSENSGRKSRGGTPLQEQPRQCPHFFGGFFSITENR
nr:cytochrome P450 CYP6A20 [Bemisia tabaci]